MCSFESAMDHCTVLNIYFIANTNTVHITTDYSIEPYAAFITHDNIANNCRIGSNEAICSPFWKFVFNRKYQSHLFYLGLQIYDFLPRGKREKRYAMTGEVRVKYSFSLYNLFTLLALL